MRPHKVGYPSGIQVKTCFLFQRAYFTVRLSDSLCLLDFRASLFTAFCHHLFPLISQRPLSSYSNHLSLGLLILLLPSGLFSKYLLKCSSMVHSYYMCYPFQCSLFNISCNIQIFIVTVIHDHFMFSIFLFLPLVRISSHRRNMANNMG